MLQVNCCEKCRPATDEDAVNRILRGCSCDCHAKDRARYGGVVRAVGLCEPSAQESL